MYTSRPIYPINRHFSFSVNNMQKIARKLKIDHAPAMMGWDFHGGWCHPV